MKRDSHIAYTHLFEIPFGELKMLREKVIRILEENELDCMVFFSPSSVFYLTGWEFFVTERPTALVLWTGGTAEMMVPRLELEHVQSVTQGIDRVVYYKDYPDSRHPMQYLKDMLSGKGKIRIGSDSPGSPAFQGYVGPSLTELLPDYDLVLLPKMIEEMRKIKSPFEISMIKESAKWGNLAMALLQEYTKPGLRELKVVHRACNEATEMMLRTLGPDFIPGGVFWVGAHGNYRGQIGADTALPHALIKNEKFKEGDIVNGSGTTYPILGYISEMERTMFVGEPTARQREFFELACQLQDFAFHCVKAGKKCSEVDREVRSFYEEHGIAEYWMHHTGHALGMDRHEPPFFDIGEDAVIEPGMVFSIEPGIYVPGFGGFRHSDTIHVTEEGIELLTYYPRDLDHLICG